MSGAAHARQVIAYRDAQGFAPFTHWLHRLRSFEVKALIAARLKRLESGHYGDYKPVGSGVYELRIFHGPGYRIYFAEHGREIILLLCGGDKKTQRHDIERAKQYWKDYRS